MDTFPAHETRPIRRTLLVGFGKLGARLAPSLIAAGSEVFALRRSASALPAGVIGIEADVASPVLVALPSVDSLVITLPPGEGFDAYRRALGHLARALPAIPERTVFVSSTGVFAGEGPGHVLTERTVPHPQTERAQAIRDGELAAQELLSAVVLRPAGIYGPGRDFLIRRVREHAEVDYRRWTNRIHESDLVRTIDTLLRMPSPPALLHAVDEEPVRLGEVVSYIASSLGMEAPPDAGAGADSGHVLDGSLLRRVLGGLEFPSFRAGYDAMLP
ncbi:hypothetical protein ACIQTT_00820 [Microbacterium sp. NPDC090225]|uniref:hypothetical protein n=1 Tax=Microbacterium sp. NPDC090225 TaxID=3364207 RepID=UPI0038303D5F